MWDVRLIIGGVLGGFYSRAAAQLLAARPFAVLRKKCTFWSRWRRKCGNVLRRSQFQPRDYSQNKINHLQRHVANLNRYLAVLLAKYNKVIKNMDYKIKARLDRGPHLQTNFGRWPPPPQSVSRSLPQGCSGSGAAAHRGLELICLSGGWMSARITLYKKKPRQESKPILFLHHIIHWVFTETDSLSICLSLKPDLSQWDTKKQCVFH